MSDQINISSEQLELVRSILQNHLQGDVKILVFGSRASGNAGRFSDLDLCLKANQSIPAAKIGALATAFEESLLPWTVDLVDWHHVSETMRDRVMSDGVELSLHTA